LNSKKIIVIKNIPENYNYLKSVKDVHKFKDGYIRLCYVGNNQSWQRIPQLVRFINKFAKDCSKKIIFNVATAEKSWFNKYLSDLNLFFEFNVSYIQNSELYNYLNSQDFLLMLRDEDEINKVACPTKAMEYLLSYTPIITTRNLGDISNYVIKHEKGVVINKPWDSIENINKVNNFLINYKRKPGLFSEIKITDYDNLLKL
jgi:oligoribonuclease (3'-5' exoribonuclease)